MLFRSLFTEIARGAILGEKDFAGNLGLRRKESHDGEGSDGFARAGFSHEAENFAGSDREIKIADGGKTLNGRVAHGYAGRGRSRRSGELDG